MANDDNSGSDPLEAILKQEIGLNTDASDFVLLAGIAYWWHPAYKPLMRADLEAEVHRRYDRRHAEPNSPRHDTRISNAILRGYGRGDYRTMEDLKQYFRSTVGLAMVGDKTKARFDEITVEYGLGVFSFMSKEMASQRRQEFCRRHRR